MAPAAIAFCDFSRRSARETVRKNWRATCSTSTRDRLRFGPISGGLFLEEAVVEVGPGTPFTPDHDQQRQRRGPRVDLHLRFVLLNMTGERWACNFGNPFSGTHFGAGQTVHTGLRAAFR